MHPELLIFQISRIWCLNGTDEGRLLYRFFDRCIGHNLGIAYAYGESVTEALYDRAAALYSTPCERGRHIYRLVKVGPEGTDEGATYRCEDCGSTDPEGDSAPALQFGQTMGGNAHA